MGVVRLIPAHAGKTRHAPSPSEPTTAHPRSRGENCQSIASVISALGSSPLTRGKREDRYPCLYVERLIPAHAGKTTSRRPRRSRSTAHPRSRGENLEEDSGLVDFLGSSPLTRGKHFLTCAFIAQIDQILESLELCASSGSYSLMDAYATDAPQDRVRSIGLAPLSSRGAS